MDLICKRLTLEKNVAAWEENGQFFFWYWLFGSFQHLCMKKAKRSGPTRRCVPRASFQFFISYDKFPQNSKSYWSKLVLKNARNESKIAV